MRLGVLAIKQRNMKYLALYSLITFCLAGTTTAQSDTKAITLADQVIEAMGGMDNYNDTRYIQWNFFGKSRVNPKIIGIS